MAGSDLHAAMDMLSSAALENQGRLLLVESQLSDLRAALRAVCAMEETPASMINLARSDRVRSASARLREVLEEILARQQRVEGWNQVPVAFSSKNPFLRPTIASKLGNSLTEFIEIAPSAASLGRERGSGGTRVSESNIFTPGNSNLTAAGRNSLAKLEVMVEKMVRILLVDRNRIGDGEPLFLPLAGEPASGKTLLAQALFNDARVMHKFVVRAWVHVSQRFDVSEILQRILDHASHSLVCIGDDQAVLKSHLRETLSDTRYLLVLDDVWSENAQEWRALLQALPSNGTLIITSRIPAVASCVATIKPHPLKTLEKKLHSKFVHLWAANANHAQVAAKQRLGTRGHDMFVLQSAYASYFHLPLDLRKCLLYCSVFPPCYEFDPEELADLLAAEGRISSTMTQPQRATYLQRLFNECFYPVEESESATSKRAYRMHSILHRFSQIIDRKISGTLCDFLTDSSKGECTPTAEFQSVRHLSVHNISDVLLRFKNVRTLILPQETFRNNMCQEHAVHLPPDVIKVLSQWFKELPQWFCRLFRHLRILSLQDCNISTLPRNFDMMSNLRYLNLSRTDIDNVPGFVSKLQFLQTLILSHCKKLQKLHGTVSKLVQLQKLDLEGCYYLVELPPDMSKMKSLQYLNIHECSSLTRMPYNMGQLVNLQTMLGYVVPNNDGRAISELQSWANLKELSMERLENISDVANVRELRLQDKQELESLAFKWNKSADDSNLRVSEVLEWLRPNQHLRTLDIVAYEGNNLPSWMTSRDTYLISLVEIRLINLKVCETLPPLGLLPLLKIVEISGAEAISSISDSFYGGNGTFPSLEKLIFSYMSNLELWEQPHSGPVFPWLAEVTIIQCPKLQLRVELPSVTKLILWMNKMLYGSKGALGIMAHSLKYVSISFCQELRASSYCEGLQDLCRLKGLELYGCDEMTCLPRGLQYLSSIRSLTIMRCKKLETLPDWLDNLPSLHLVRLSACFMLHSFPEGLRQRRCTQISIESCPKLSSQSLDVISDNFGGEKSTMREPTSENLVKNLPCSVHFKGFGDSEPAPEIASDLVQPDLYGIVMSIPGFTEEQLMCALSHLLDNEIQSKAFMDMPESRRIWWIGKFVAKHFEPYF